MQRKDVKIMEYKFTVKQAREYRELTIAEMARKIGLSSSTYYRWERNPQNISMESAERISSILNIPANDLIFCPANH